MASSSRKPRQARRFTIRAKILAITGTLIALIAVVSLFGIQSLKSVQGISVDLYADHTVALDELGRIQVALMDDRRLVLRRMVDIGDADKQKLIDEQVQAARRSSTKTLRPTPAASSTARRTSWSTPSAAPTPSTGSGVTSPRSS